MGGGCAETVCVAQKRNCFEFKIHTLSRSTHHTHIQPARLIKKVKKKRKGKKKTKKTKKTKKKSMYHNYRVMRGESEGRRDPGKNSRTTHTHTLISTHTCPVQPSQPSSSPATATSKGRHSQPNAPQWRPQIRFPHGRLPLVSIICPE